MVLKLVPIGNSIGIRIPKAVRQQTGIKDKVTLRVEGEEIILAPKRKDPRAGWEDAFKKASAKHGNNLTKEDREWLDAPIDVAPDEWE